MHGRRVSVINTEAVAWFAAANDRDLDTCCRSGCMRWCSSSAVPPDAPGRRHGTSHGRLDSAAAARDLALTLGGRFEDIRFLVGDRGSNFAFRFNAALLPAAIVGQTMSPMRRLASKARWFATSSA
jgi:hypothetical protein